MSIIGIIKDIIINSILYHHKHHSIEAIKGKVRKHQWGQRARMWVQIILSLRYELLIVPVLVIAILLLVLVIVMLHMTSVENPELLIVICIAR